MSEGMLTPEQIAEIRERERAATEGPWKLRSGENCIHVESVDGRFSTGCISWDGNGAANAAFIAFARRDIPALLAHLDAVAGENEQLRNQSAQLRTERDAARGAWDSAEYQLNELRSSLATLTRERAEWEQIARGHFADLQEARDSFVKIREAVERVSARGNVTGSLDVADLAFVLLHCPIPAPTEA